MDQELYNTIVGCMCEASFWRDAKNNFTDLFKDVNSARRYIRGNYKTDQLNGSIMRRAAGLVLVFPVLVSSSISINTAILISKAIERKCVSFLQMLFSAINLTDRETVKDLYDYIAQFHTNLEMPSRSISLDDFITVMNNAHNEGAITYSIPKSQVDAIMNELAALCIPANSYLRESSLNDYSITKDSRGHTFINEAITDLSTGKTSGTPRNKTTMGRTAEPSSQNMLFTSQILSGDIKKANELQPTNMIVNFKIKTDDGSIADAQSGIIGVKAKLYPIDSSEILTRISDKYTSGFLFNFIRASTGEKSFWKDLVFAFDKIKNNAIRIAKGSTNAKIFNLLERRAARSKSKLLNAGDANPITTLIISREEVEYLKKNNSIDLDKASATSTLFSGYNLMGLVIVDDSIECAYFLFDDGSNSYERISYEALEKETDDKNYKKIVNLLSRGGRV